MNLLDELDEHGGFTHAFLTSYTFQPAFFEDRVLPCKALSSCPNIVVFVDRLKYDEVCSGTLGGSLINRRYMLVPVSRGAGGVFHPKLWLFAGEKRSRLFVGSANLTRPGITTNMEMMSLFDDETASEGFLPLFSEAFGFIEALAGRCCTRTETLDRVLAGARVYASLRGKAGECHGVALVHNLDVPLIDALPSSLPGRGLSVTVFGPFYDTKIGTVLDNLLTRGTVSDVEIIVQQDTNTLDVRALARWCRQNSDVEVRVSTVDLPGRSLHAKGMLLRDSKGGPVLSLLGSANFTEPALIRSEATGGNVEVGLRLVGDAATVVQQALASPPFNEREVVDLASVRSRPEIPATDSARKEGSVTLLSAEIAGDFSRIDVRIAGPRAPGLDRARTDLCVQRCDKTFMDFACPPIKWESTGRASFRLSPQNVQFLSRAAKTWLSTRTDAGDVWDSNAVWLLHLDEVTESEKKQEAKVIRQFRESGKGLTSHLQALIDQGAIDRSVDLLENLSIKYSGDLSRPRGLFLRPRHSKSSMREDEVPLSVWRLTTDQRRRLGEAVQDFVGRHHEKVLERHIRNPNPNGLENFLDVLETCTELSMKAGREELLESDTVLAMIRGGLSLFSGNVLREGYAKALRGHMWAHDDELRRAYEDVAAAERVATILLAVACVASRGRRNTPAEMTLKELIGLTGLDRLDAFFSFVGEPAASLPAKVAERIADYAEPALFTLRLFEGAPVMPQRASVLGLTGYD